MKLRRYIFILLPLIFIGFIACNDRPIFAAIEQEIDLKDFSVEGNILSLLEAGENVYASNRGGVYSKSKKSDGSWSKILSVSGTQKLAHDNANIVFACFGSGSVKYYEAGNWNTVPGSGNIRIIAGDNIVFGYDESQEKVFKITKTGLTDTIHSGKVDSLFAAGNYVVVKSGSSETMYKADTSPVTVVENLPSGVKGMCSAGDADKIFVLAGSSIHYCAGGAWSSNTKSISDKTPISISYFKERKTILVGCTNGYTEVKLNTPINLSNATQFNPGDSGSTTPPGSYSQYQTTLGSYYTYPVLGVDRDNGDYAVFMGIYSGVIKRNTGLWGFYSDKKREWNRE